LIGRCTYRPAILVLLAATVACGSRAEGGVAVGNDAGDASEASQATAADAFADSEAIDAGDPPRPCGDAACVDAQLCVWNLPPCPPDGPCLPLPPACKTFAPSCAQPTCACSNQAGFCTNGCESVGYGEVYCIPGQ
jgi:hypothetical protein